jgi:hypothetical protein
MRLVLAQLAEITKLAEVKDERSASFSAEISVPWGSRPMLERAAKAAGVEIELAFRQGGIRTTYLVKASGPAALLIAFKEKLEAKESRTTLRNAGWAVEEKAIAPPITPATTTPATTTPATTRPATTTPGPIARPEPVRADQLELPSKLDVAWRRSGSDRPLWDDDYDFGIGRSWTPSPPPLPKKPMLTSKDVETLEGAAKALAKTLEDPALEAAIAAARAKITPQSAKHFEENLAAFALLADCATSIGGSVSSIEAYRMGAMSGDRPRNDASRKTLAKSLKEALAAEKPGKAVAASLVENFLHEIGATAPQRAQWHPTTKGIRAALAQEALMPMRVLNETIESSLGKYPMNARLAVRKGLDDILAHIVKGDYREWVYSNPIGAAQLACLTAPQREAWKKPTSVEHPGSVKTREIDDIWSFWVTKVLSMSHAFDGFMRQCILPLVGNARTKAIVVDDPQRPNAPSARAYLRMFEVEGIGPVVYLDSHVIERGDRTTMRMALLRHAAKKAEEMGVLLAVNEGGSEFSKGGDSRYFNIKLLKSTVGIEASDTISAPGSYHDWDNTTDMRAEARAQIVDPKSLRG